MIVRLPLLVLAMVALLAAPWSRVRASSGGQEMPAEAPETEAVPPDASAPPAEQGPPGARSDPAAALPSPQAIQAVYTARLADDALVDGRGRLIVRSVQSSSEFWHWPETNLAIQDPRWLAEAAEERNGGIPARLGRTSLGTTAVWTPPGRHVLEFAWSARGRQGPVGGLLFDLRLPPAAAGLLVLDIPKEWRLIASAGAVEGPEAVAGEPDRRRWQLTLGGHNAVALQLSPEEAVPRAEPLVLSRLHLGYEVTESGVLLQATIRPEVLRQAIAALEVWVDPRLRITEVSYQDPERPLQWTVEAGAPPPQAVVAAGGAGPAEPEDGGEVAEPPGGGQILRIQLPEPQFGVASRIRLQGVAALDRGRAWVLPTVRPLGTFWQEGTATVRVRAPLVVEQLDVEAGRQVDVRPVVDSADEDIQLQFFEPSGSVTLVVERAEARLDVRMATRLRWSPEREHLESVILWTSRAGEAFELPCRIPSGWQVTEVVASPPDALRDWTVTADGRRLLIRPIRPVSPQTPLRVRVHLARAGVIGGGATATPAQQPLPLLEPVVAGNLRGLITIDAAPYELMVEGPALGSLDSESEASWRAFLDGDDEYLGAARTYEGSVFAVFEARPARGALEAQLVSNLSIEADGWVEELRIDGRSLSGDEVAALVVYFPPLRERPADRVPPQAVVGAEGQGGSAPTRVSWRPSSIEAVRLPASMHHFWGLPPEGQLWRLDRPAAHSDDGSFTVRCRREYRDHRLGRRSPVGSPDLYYAVPTLPGAQRATGRIEVHADRPDCVILEPEGLRELPLAANPRVCAVFATEGGGGRLAILRDRERAPSRHAGRSPQPTGPQRGAGGVSFAAEPSLQVLQAQVDVVLNAFGTQQYVATYTIRCDEPRALPVRLPTGAEFIEIQVDGAQWATPPAGSESAGLVSLDGPGAHHVRLVYEMQAAPLGFYCRPALALPEVAAIGPVGIRLWLPADYSLVTPPDGWRLVDPPTQPRPGRFPNVLVARIAGPLARSEGEPFNPFRPEDWRALVEGSPSRDESLRALDQAEAVLAGLLAQRGPEAGEHEASPPPRQAGSSAGGAAEAALTLSGLLTAYAEQEGAPLLVVDAVGLSEASVGPGTPLPPPRDETLRDWLRRAGLALIGSRRLVMLTSVGERSRQADHLELHGGRFVIADPQLRERLVAELARGDDWTRRWQSVAAWTSGGAHPSARWAAGEVTSEWAAADPGQTVAVSGFRLVRLVTVAGMEEGWSGGTIAVVRESTVGWLSTTAFVFGLGLGLWLTRVRRSGGGPAWPRSAPAAGAAAEGGRPQPGPVPPAAENGGAKVARTAAEGGGPGDRSRLRVLGFRRFALVGSLGAAWAGAVVVPPVLVPIFSLLGWGLIAALVVRRLGGLLRRAPTAVHAGAEPSSSQGASGSPRPRISSGLGAASTPLLRALGLLMLAVLVGAPGRSSLGQDDGTEAPAGGAEGHRRDAGATDIEGAGEPPSGEPPSGEPASGERSSGELSSEEQSSGELSSGELASDAADASPAYLLSGGTFTGVVDTGGSIARATIRAEWDVFVVGESATLILPFDERAGLLVDGCRLDGDVRRPLPVEDGIALEIRGEGEHHLTVEFAPRIVEEGGRSTISFAVVPLVSNRLILDWPAELGVRLRGSRGTMHVDTLMGGGVARLEANLGPVAEVRLEWSALEPPATAAPAVDVEEYLLWDVHPASLVLSAMLRYEPSGEVQHVSLLLDPGLRFRRVRSGPDLDVYESVTRSGEQQLLVLELEEPQTEPFELRLEFVATAASGVGNFRVPRLTPYGVRDARGLIAVRISDELEAHLLGDVLPAMVEAEEFAEAWPEPLEGGPPEFIYAASAPETLAVSTRPRSPGKTAVEMLRLTAGQQAVLLEIETEITTSVAPSFQHRFYVGPELQVQNVSVTERDVDRLSHWALDEEGYLRLFLNGPTAGTQQVRIAGRYLLGPPGELTLAGVGLAEGELTSRRIVLADGGYAEFEIGDARHLEPLPPDGTEPAGGQGAPPAEAAVAAARSLRATAADYVLSVRVVPNDREAEGDEGRPGGPPPSAAAPPPNTPSSGAQTAGSRGEAESAPASGTGVSPLTAAPEGEAIEVLLADITLVENAEGELGRARFCILRSGVDEIRFSLPPGRQLDRVDVDGRPAEWRFDTNGAVTASVEPRSYPQWVELVWHENAARGAAHGVSWPAVSAQRRAEAVAVLGASPETVLWTIYPPADTEVEPLPPDGTDPAHGRGEAQSGTGVPPVAAEAWELDLARLHAVVTAVERISRDDRLVHSAFTRDWVDRTWLLEAERLRRRLQLVDRSTSGTRLDSGAGGRGAPPPEAVVAERAPAMLAELEVRLDSALRRLGLESRSPRAIAEGASGGGAAAASGRGEAQSGTGVSPVAAGGDPFERPGMGSPARFLGTSTGGPTVRLTGQAPEIVWLRLAGVAAVALVCGAALLVFARRKPVWRLAAAVLVAAAWWYWLQPSWLAPLALILVALPARSLGPAGGDGGTARRVAAPAQGGLSGGSQKDVEAGARVASSTARP